MKLRRPLLGTAATVATIVGLLIGSTSAFATTYATGSSGYDISYPQCGASYPAGAFGIVGVNAGYPFTYYNSCFTSEWAYATRTASPSLYINTGYDPSYTAVDSRHTLSDCLTRSALVAGTAAQQQAWAVGCSEAQRSIGWASCQNATDPGSCTTTVAPAAWWLDIETGNSWCGLSGTTCSDLTLNEYTVQGILDTLHRRSPSPVGVYSTSYQWTVIVGNHPVTGVNADWVATAQRSARRAKAYCASSGFTGAAPVWLVQFLPGSYDADYAC
jgi:hypothetical protein